MRRAPAEEAVKLPAVLDGRILGAGRRQRLHRQRARPEQVAGQQAAEAPAQGLPGRTLPILCSSLADISRSSSPVSHLRLGVHVPHSARYAGPSSGRHGQVQGRLVQQGFAATHRKPCMLHAEQACARAAGHRNLTRQRPLRGQLLLIRRRPSHATAAPRARPMLQQCCGRVVCVSSAAGSSCASTRPRHALNSATPSSASSTRSCRRTSGGGGAHGAARPPPRPRSSSRRQKMAAWPASADAAPMPTTPTADPSTGVAHDTRHARPTACAAAARLAPATSVQACKRRRAHHRCTCASIERQA